MYLLQDFPESLTVTSGCEKSSLPHPSVIFLLPEGATLSYVFDV